MSEGEAYLDIVWRQFKKNRLAYFCLWPTLGLLLTAICAPLLASNVPLVFFDGRETIYPWFSSLFNPAESIDFVFNMALVSLAPWVAVAVTTNWWQRRRGVPGRRRAAAVFCEFLLLTVAAAGVFSFAAMRPLNRFSLRDFPTEEFESHGEKHGVYAVLPFGPIEQDLDSRFEGPGYRAADSRAVTKSNQHRTHWLGTYTAGEDVLARIIYGTRISMSVGIVAVGIYMAIGIVVGAVAGYFGGGPDMVISRVIEIVLLFPALFLILTVVALLGQNIFYIMAVIGITGWPGIARLIRGEVLKQRSLDYTLAAQALGASHRRILFRHILANSLGPALVSVPFGIASAIITEASLSLLGLGVREPAPSWGNLLHTANEDYHRWWLVVFPSIAIFITVTLFNLVGNGLRDAMDPRLRI